MSKLQDLTTLLRNRADWPEDFEWDYSDITHCAVGLACEVGLIRGKRPSRVEGADFDISDAAFDAIFMTWGRGGPDAVTPQMVVRRIERLAL